MTPDGRTIRGERTRAAVLDAAVALATEAGLEGLSLSQLADTLGVSKSGLFAHWRSKEELQLATIEHALGQWLAQIITPALRQPRGVRRLWTLHLARIDFYTSAALPGGCFFTNLGFEYNARTGPIRDRIVQLSAEWMTFLESLAAQATALGELHPDVDVRQLAYEIDAIGINLVVRSRLLDAGIAYTYARRAVLDRLRALCPDPALLPED